jgi:RimJ/RimL family protein N-acetyltransferase
VRTRVRHREAAKASLDFGLRVLCLDRIVSIHQIGNHTSGRIMQKFGMTFVSETIDKTCSRPVSGGAHTHHSASGSISPLMIFMT